MTRILALIVSLLLVYTSSIEAAPPPTTISTSGVDASDPRILVIPGGTAVAIWVENNIVTSRYAGSNLVWSSPPDVLSGSGGATPKIAQDSSGNIVAVWAENGVIKSSTRTASNNTWSSPSDTLSSSGASEPRIAVDPNGNAVAVWVRNGTIESANRPSAGSWSSVNVISGSSADLPSVSVDPNGNAVAAWTQVVAGVSSIYAATKPLSGAWTSAVQVSTASVNSTGVHVASYPNGNALAIWFRYVVSGSDYSSVVLQYATWNGSSWNTPTDLTSAGLMNPANLSAMVRIDSLGNAYAFWTMSFDGSQIVIETASAPLNQTTFASVMDLISPNPLVLGFDSAGETGGSALLAWMSLDSTGSFLVIQVIYKTLSGSWIAPILVSNGGQNDDPHVSVLKDTNFIYLSGVWQNYNGTNKVIQAEFIVQPRIQPASSPTVTQQTNDYTVTTDVTNTISWTASPSLTVNGYLIYRGSTLIGQTAASVLTFTDYNRTLNEVLTYTIIAVDINGTQSVSVTANSPS